MCSEPVNLPPGGIGPFTMIETRAGEWQTHAIAEPSATPAIREAHVACATPSAIANALNTRSATSPALSTSMRRPSSPAMPLISFASSSALASSASARRPTGHRRGQARRSGCTGSTGRRWLRHERAWLCVGSRRGTTVGRCAGGCARWRMPRIAGCWSGTVCRRSSRGGVAFGGAPRGVGCLQVSGVRGAGALQITRGFQRPASGTPYTRGVTHDDVDRPSHAPVPRVPLQGLRYLGLT